MTRIRTIAVLFAFLMGSVGFAGEAKKPPNNRGQQAKSAPRGHTAPSRGHAAPPRGHYAPPRGTQKPTPAPAPPRYAPPTRERQPIDRGPVAHPYPNNGGTKTEPRRPQPPPRVTNPRDNGYTPPRQRVDKEPTGRQYDGSKTVSPRELERGRNDRQPEKIYGRNPKTDDRGRGFDRPGFPRQIEPKDRYRGPRNYDRRDYGRRYGDDRGYSDYRYYWNHYRNDYRYWPGYLHHGWNNWGWSVYFNLFGVYIGSNSYYCLPGYWQYDAFRNPWYYQPGLCNSPYHNHDYDWYGYNYSFFAPHYEWRVVYTWTWATDQYGYSYQAYRPQLIQVRVDWNGEHYCDSRYSDH